MNIKTLLTKLNDKTREERFHLVMAGEIISCNNEDFMLDQKLILMNVEGNFIKN